MLLPLILETDDLVKKVVVLIENEKAERVRQRQTQKRVKMERFQRAMETRCGRTRQNGSKREKISVLMNLDRFSIFPYIVVMMKNLQSRC